MQRPISTAELLLVGTELTTGETRDTNGAELAGELTRRGVAVTRLVALPDTLDVVRDAIRAALGRADLVITSGGLGPTPDDLTREAIAAACDTTPFVDPELERWLRGLFERRGIQMPEVNRKQAWLIQGATPVRNEEGTAPGWWVERADGRLIVALPGPPLELRAIWRSEVLPRLQARGVGMAIAVRTLRLTDIGESHVADRLGEALLRAANPVVATYARADAVDVRISARIPVSSGKGPSGERSSGGTSSGERSSDGVPGIPSAGISSGGGASGGASGATDIAAASRGLQPHGPSARGLVEEAERVVRERLGDHIFAVDDETWTDALGARLRARRLAVLEVGSGGALAGLLGDAPWLVYAEVRPAGWGDTDHPVRPDGSASDAPPSGATRRADPRDTPQFLGREARRVRRRAGAEIGLALDVDQRGNDSIVHVALILGPSVRHARSTVRRAQRTVFRSGEQGRRRAALAACSVLWRALGDGPAD